MRIIQLCVCILLLIATPTMEVSQRGIAQNSDSDSDSDSDPPSTSPIWIEIVREIKYYSDGIRGFLIGLFNKLTAVNVSGCVAAWDKAFSFLEDVNLFILNEEPRPDYTDFFNMLNDGLYFIITIADTCRSLPTASREPWLEVNCIHQIIQSNKLIIQINEVNICNPYI